MSLVTFIALFFIWCLVVENSLGQAMDREAEFATELLKVLEEGAKTQEKAKNKGEIRENSKKQGNCEPYLSNRVY